MPAGASEQRPTRSRRRGSFEYWGGTNGEPPDKIVIPEGFRVVTVAPSDTEESAKATDTHETSNDSQGR